MRVVALAAALIAGLLAWSAPPAAAQPARHAPRIWFAPMDPHFRSDFFHAGGSDFDQLFAAGAPWGRAASRVSVFKLYMSYVLRSSDQELRNTIVWLQQHRIALAMEAPMLTAPRPDCGHVEGYGAAQTIRAAQRLRAIGARLDILTTSEGLWFGHFYNGPSACHTPIPALVDDVVQTAQQLRTLYPGLQFADIEPISNFRDPDWVNAVGQWLALFRQQSGTPYVGVELDIAWWQQGWQERVRAITTYLRRIGIPIGVMYTGDAPDKSSAGWLRDLARNWHANEALVGLPDDAIFQSWLPVPDDDLPENAADSFTGVLLQYEMAHP